MDQRNIVVTVSGDIGRIQHLALEGFDIGLTKPGSRDLPHFPINGSLDVFFYCLGWSGTRWTLEIAIDSCKEPFKWTGHIDKGYGSLAASIDVHKCRILEEMIRWS